MLGSTTTVQWGAVVLLLCFIVAGCAGNSTRPDLGAPPPPVYPDLQPPPPPRDFGPAPDTTDPCVFDDGQSCEGGQVCPKGLQPIIQGDGKCYCRPPCVPEQPGQCGGARCDRVCVPKTDSSGKPIPGSGSCLPDPGQAEGHPCGPATCKQLLACVGSTSEQAFCRRTCTGAGPGECAGFKMVCGEVTTGDKQLVCVPGENAGGPGVGGDCAADGTFCNKNLICDPKANVCRKACNTDGAGDTCTKGTCKPLVDEAAGVTLGFGCK